MWKALAQGSDSDDSRRAFARFAAEAFARAARGGISQLWAEAAESYDAAGPAFARNRSFCSAQASLWAGDLRGAIKAFATAAFQVVNPTGALADEIADSHLRAAIVSCASRIQLEDFAADPELLGYAVGAFVGGGARAEAKNLLGRVGQAGGTLGGVSAYRRLASMEEEDGNFPLAVSAFERAGDWERAWTLTRRHPGGISERDLARIEGKTLAQRYEQQREPSRPDADRAITLLREVGDFSTATHVEELRISRERSPLEKVKLILAAGDAPGKIVDAMDALNSMQGDPPNLAEARQLVLQAVSRSPQLLDTTFDRLHTGTSGWLRETGSRDALRAEVSDSEWGLIVEVTFGPLNAKEYYKPRVAEAPWAQQGFRRSIGQLVRKARESDLPEETRERLLSALESSGWQ